MKICEMTQQVAHDLFLEDFTFSSENFSNSCSLLNLLNRTTVELSMENLHKYQYGVATISRLIKIIGLYCRISSLLYGSFAKETYNFKEPTNRSHPIGRALHRCLPQEFLKNQLTPTNMRLKD